MPEILPSADDLFTVVHDPFVSVTARWVDIVLPAATYFETEDLYRAYGTYYMQYAPAAVPPQGEAWSNLRLAQELARRMGLSDRVFGLTQEAILGDMLRGGNGATAGLDPARVREAGPIHIAPAGGQAFRTPKLKN